MSTILTSYRVFIASPGGVQDERAAFREGLEEYNQNDGIHRGVHFAPIGWEDTLGGVGRPQSIIDQEIETCDYFVLLLWDRWGTPPDGSVGKFSSGTEAEFYLAMECLDNGQQPMREVLIFFKAVDPSKLSDAGPQLQKVLDFRRRIEEEKKHLHYTFDDLAAFSHRIRGHLARWVRDHEAGGTVEPSGKSDSPLDQPAHEMLETSLGISPLSRNQELISEAWSLASEGHSSEAEVAFATATTSGDDPEAFRNYGRFLVQVGRLGQAQVMFNRALTISKTQDDQVSAARTYGSLGNLLRIKGDLGGAEEMHRMALVINKRRGRSEGLASNYGNLGNILYTQGDLDGAEEMYRRALKIYERLGGMDGRLFIYPNLGNVLLTRGDLDSAEEMYREGLKLNEQIGNFVGIAGNSVNLGAVLQARGDLDGAEELYRKALEINERLGRLEGLANNYGNLGNVLQARGDLDGAEQLQRKALEFSERLGHPAGVAVDYGNLGEVLQARGDLDGAEELYRKALEINERLGRLEGMASDYKNLGNVLQVRGDLDGGEEMLRVALEIEERLGRPAEVAKVRSLIDGLRPGGSES